MSQYNVKNLTSQHAQQASYLHAQCFKKSWEDSFFRNIFESSGGVGLGAFGSSGELIGFCLGQWVIDEAEILTILVKKSERRKGVAFSLLSQMLTYLKQQGVKKMFLEVHEKNQSALSLYEKLYFKPVGIRKHYYLDTEEMPANAIVLELVLNK